MLLGLCANAQTYEVNTNYCTTNFLAATSNGTNVFYGVKNDMRFYWNTVWYVELQSDNGDDSNEVDIVFASMPNFTATNRPAYLSVSNVFSARASGTNLVCVAYEVTNFPHSAMVPVAFTNHVTGNITNFSLWSSSKGYTKDRR